MSATLYMISAPSGAGKTSLVKALLADTPSLISSISHTTRSPRKSEVSGVHYHFLSLTQFQHMIQQGAFLEYAKVFDNYYGTGKYWIEKQLDQNIDVIVEIDWQGAKQIKLCYPDAVSIFILPPSIGSLKKRLLNRKEDTLATITKRLEAATLDIAQAFYYDYLIINDQFEDALSDLKSIIRTRRLCTTFHSTHIQNLLTQHD